MNCKTNVCYADNLHELVKPYFLKKKTYVTKSSAAVVTGSLRV